MNNYIPVSDNDRQEMIKQNPLYLELFERRLDQGCFNCDYSESSADVCASCMHNFEDDLELKPIKSILPLRKEKIDIKRSLLLHKCPVCDNKDWTKLSSTYFNKKGTWRVADILSKYCPYCGQDLREKEAIKEAKEEEHKFAFSFRTDGEFYMEDLDNK